jgi:acetamidase/formamidase
MPRTHHLPDERVHFTWDVGNEPVLEIESGGTVVVWTREVSDRAMVDHIGDTDDLGREDANQLFSLVVDLEISEIVDAGQYIVSAVLPEAVFGETRRIT